MFHLALGMYGSLSVVLFILMMAFVGAGFFWKKKGESFQKHARSCWSSHFRVRRLPPDCPCRTVDCTGAHKLQDGGAPDVTLKIPDGVPPLDMGEVHAETRRREARAKARERRNSLSQSWKEQNTQGRYHLPLPSPSYAESHIRTARSTYGCSNEMSPGSNGKMARNSGVEGPSPSPRLKGDLSAVFLPLSPLPPPPAASPRGSGCGDQPHNCGGVCDYSDLSATCSGEVYGQRPGEMAGGPLSFSGSSRGSASTSAFTSGSPLESSPTRSSLEICEATPSSSNSTLEGSPTLGSATLASLILNSSPLVTSNGGPNRIPNSSHRRRSRHEHSRSPSSHARSTSSNSRNRKSASVASFSLRRSSLSKHHPPQLFNSVPASTHEKLEFPTLPPSSTTSPATPFCSLDPTTSRTSSFSPPSSNSTFACSTIPRLLYRHSEADLLASTSTQSTANFHNT